MLSEEALTDQLCGQIIKMIDDMQTYQLKPENMKKVLSAVQSHAMNKMIDVVYQQGVQDGMNKTNTEEKSVSEIMDSVEMPNVAFDEPSVNEVMDSVEMPNVAFDNPSVNETMSSVEMPNVAFEEEPKVETVSGPGAPQLIDPIVASASMMGGSAAAATSAGVVGVQEEHAKSAMSMEEANVVGATYQDHINDMTGGTNTEESTLEETPLSTFEEPENENVGTLIEEPMDRELPGNEYTEEDERFIQEIVDSLNYNNGEFLPTLGEISEHDKALMVEAKRRYQENQIKL